MNYDRPERLESSRARSAEPGTSYAIPLSGMAYVVPFAVLSLAGCGEAEAEPQPAAAPAVAAVKSDEMTIKLTPGQGAEIKLEMLKGATVSFHWTGNGGRVNYDTHGDPYGAPRSFYHGYGKGRFTPEVEGTLEAAFDGYHGWFWRNRTKKDVTVTLRVEGDYIAIKRVL